VAERLGMARIGGPSVDGDDEEQLGEPDRLPGTKRGRKAPGHELKRNALASAGIPSRVPAPRPLAGSKATKQAINWEGLRARHHSVQSDHGDGDRQPSLAGLVMRTKNQVEAIVQALGGIGRVLREATTSERADVYRSLGVRMVYDDRSHQVRVVADLARVAGGVGGGTRYKTPRRLPWADLWLAVD
jgi:hypothetical protein